MLCSATAPPPQVTDKVREKLTAWDPVLAEYIRLHLYGDVYSSPGLGMRQKQLLTVAFLGEANMHDQLYTHAIAVSPCGCVCVWVGGWVNGWLGARGATGRGQGYDWGPCPAIS